MSQRRKEGKGGSLQNGRWFSLFPMVTKDLTRRAGRLFPCDFGGPAVCAMRAVGNLPPECKRSRKYESRSDNSRLNCPGSQRQPLRLQLSQYQAEKCKSLGYSKSVRYEDVGRYKPKPHSLAQALRERERFRSTLRTIFFLACHILCGSTAHRMRRNTHPELSERGWIPHSQALCFLSNLHR